MQETVKQMYYFLLLTSVKEHSGCSIFPLASIWYRQCLGFWLHECAVISYCFALQCFEDTWHPCFYLLICLWFSFSMRWLLSSLPIFYILLLVWVEYILSYLRWVYIIRFVFCKYFLVFYGLFYYYFFIILHIQKKWF